METRELKRSSSWHRSDAKGTFLYLIKKIGCVKMIVILSDAPAEQEELIKELVGLGFPATCTLSIPEIEKSSGIIIPDQESYEKAMTTLKGNQLVPVIKAAAKANKTIIGIGLGLHLLFEGQLGANYLTGLNLLEGLSEELPLEEESEHAFPAQGKLLGVAEDLISQQEDQDLEVYFTKPYWVDCELELIKGLGQGSLKFPAIIQAENIWGLHFLPEKSGDVGRELLKKIITS